MNNSKSLYHGHRFPAVVISCAVRWYFRFELSLRDIEELLFESGIVVSYETVRRWCDKLVWHGVMDAVITIQILRDGYDTSVWGMRSTHAGPSRVEPATG